MPDTLQLSYDPFVAQLNNHHLCRQSIMPERLATAEDQLALLDTPIQEHVRDHLDKIHRENDERHEQLWGIRQPHAEQILGDIAYFNHSAQEQLDTGASHEEVWMKSLEIATQLVKVSAERTKATDDNTARLEFEQSIDTALVMAALDAVHGGGNGAKNMIQDLEEASLGAGILESLERTDSQGMAIANEDGSSFERVGDAVRSVCCQLVTDEIAKAVDEARHELQASQKQNHLPEWMREQHQKQYLRGLLRDIADGNNRRFEQVMRTPNLTNGQLGGLVDALRQAQDWLNRQPDETDEYSFGASDKGYGVIMNAFTRIPSGQLQDFYHSDQSTSLREMMTQALDRPTIVGGLKNVGVILAKAHGVKPHQLSRGGREDPILQQALESDQFCLSTMFPDKNLLTKKSEFPRFTQEIRDNQEVYIKQLGLPDKLADEIMRAMDERTMAKDSDGFTARGDDRCIDGSKVWEEMRALRERVRNLGVEKLMSVRETCGIVNFKNYETGQLERMHAFATGDEMLLEQLRAGDVTVVFTDAKGDHNDAAASNSFTFDKPSGRTLYFEINQPTDFYRHLLLLEKTGIKPSRLVVSTHGRPGAMFFGDDEERFALTNASAEAMRKAEVQEAEANRKAKERGEEARPVVPRMAIEASRALPRIAERFMQESRGIDDEKAGGIEVILKSCSQAVARMVERGSGEEKHEVLEAMTDTLAQKLGPKVRIVGAPDVAGTRKVGNQLEFRNPHGHLVDVYVSQVDKAGNVVTITTESIPLHKNYMREAA